MGVEYLKATRDDSLVSIVPTQLTCSVRSFLRSVAYRQYVQLIYEYVGTSGRIPLLNCVYNRIRKALADANADGEYGGYEEEESQG